MWLCGGLINLAALARDNAEVEREHGLQRAPFHRPQLTPDGVGHGGEWHQKEAGMAVERGVEGTGRDAGRGAPPSIAHN